MMAKPPLFREANYIVFINVIYKSIVAFYLPEQGKMLNLFMRMIPSLWLLRPDGEAVSLMLQRSHARH